MAKNNPQSQIVIYQTEDGQAKVNVRFEGETVWLSQKLMAELFQCSTDNISLLSLLAIASIQSEPPNFVFGRLPGSGTI